MLIYVFNFPQSVPGILALLGKKVDLISLLLLSLLFLFFLPQHSAAAEEPSKKWHVEAIAATGVIFEAVENVTFSKGGGISVNYRNGPWYATGRYRLDAYRMSYFGTSSNVAFSFLGGDFDSGILDKVEVAEQKEDVLVGIGLKVWNHINIYQGIRRIRFKNSFSSMELLGPGLGGEWTLPWKEYKMVLGLDWAANFFGSVTNNNDEFVAFDGRETISFYGEPRYQLDWRALFGFQAFSWMGVGLGYEGAVTVFEGVARNYHGVTLIAEF